MGAQFWWREDMELEEESKTSAEGVCFLRGEKRRAHVKCIC
jgi:hypothetical protein